MMDNRFQMMMKVTMQLTDTAFGSLGNKEESNYTGNHVAVFECELKAPPQLAMIDHSLSEYMLAHRINFRNWKLVDFDNYMSGNPYFAKSQTIEEFTKNVDKLTGPLDEIEMKSNPKQQDFRKMMEKYENFLSMKEPLSNSGMVVLN